MINEYLLGSPLIIISILSIISIVLDALVKNKTVTYTYTLVGLAIVLASAAYVMSLPVPDINTIDAASLLSRRMITFGGYASLFDILFCIAGILTVMAGRPFIAREYHEYSEFYSLIMLSIGGMMLISHTNNLLILFIGIEIMSVSFYILAGFFRSDKFSVEASLKYFLLGAFSTGFLLYGIALLYGSTGSLDLTTISGKIMAGNYTQVYLIIGLGLLIIGLSFKTAIFPFHQWAPDVYHGSPTIVTGFMSTAGKSAALIGFIVVARALIAVNYQASSASPAAAPAPSNMTGTIQFIIALLSAGTMLIGNISALVQKNVKRMLAYSSVAHAGYLLMGIVANNAEGWRGIIFYSYAYMFMQIGAFVVVSVLERHSEKYMELKDYSGLRKTHPFLAAVMAVFMFTLVGLPPFAGFFGKYYLFAAAIKAGYTWLTIVAVIATMISIYFYIGLIVYMYFSEPEEETVYRTSPLAKITLAVSVAGVLILGIFPSIVADAASWFF
jgi:NADH-quinone oxidoreductase subunit N